MKNARTVRFDGVSITSSDEFFAKLAEQVKLPPYFGNNLNALWDVISAGEIADNEEPIEIVWSNAEKARHRLGGFFEQLITVLRRAEKEVGWVTLKLQ